MKVLNRDSGVFGVIKPVQRLDAEHKDRGKVQYYQCNDDTEYAHPRGRGKVTLAVVS